MIFMSAASVLFAALSPALPAETVRLFDGKSLTGWTMDIPDADEDPTVAKPFLVRDGVLVSLGKPMGHLVTDGAYESYKLVVEYRFVKEAGNSGVIVHVSKLRALNNFLPQGIECQLRSGNAGDFHLFNETLKQRGTQTEANARRLVNFTDNSEKPIGEWNRMEIECKEDTIKVWVNGDLVNDGYESSVRRGRIAIQSEGTEVEFRKIDLTPLAKP